MKKFCVGILLTVAVIFCSQIQAEAYNVDMGIYPASGLRGYLMTETISIGNGNFNCTVGNPYYIDYYFYQGRGGFYFRNSDGYTVKLSRAETPVEYNVWEYVTNNYRL